MTPKLSGLIVPYTNTGHHRCSELKLSSPQGTRYLHLNSHQKGESQRSYWLGKAEAERRAWCKLGRLQGGWEEREREARDGQNSAAFRRAASGDGCSVPRGFRGWTVFQIPSAP
uniref:Uncharacterized protein n=1 Tax=Setaria viridis TaxID=4556 RepID=A0A4U6T982_SETVI|nr:hypothetical protein SEVIR_9G489500v2 [Setaria viridis]